MLIQLLALSGYTLLAAVVLALLKSYRLSIRNLVSFVAGGGVGALAAGLVGNLLPNDNGEITQTYLVVIFLVGLFLGLSVGSYLGLRFLGAKENGT